MKYEIVDRAKRYSETSYITDAHERLRKTITNSIDIPLTMICYTQSGTLRQPHTNSNDADFGLSTVYNTSGPSVSCGYGRGTVPLICLTRCILRYSPLQRAQTGTNVGVSAHVLTVKRPFQDRAVQLQVLPQRRPLILTRMTTGEEWSSSI